MKTAILYFVLAAALVAFAAFVTVESMAALKLTGATVDGLQVTLPGRTQK